MLLPDDLERIRATYSISFEGMLDRLTEAVLRHPAAVAPEAEVRRRLHGILNGTIAFALQPGPEYHVMEEVGGMVYSLCDGSREALADIRMTLADTLLLVLSDEDRARIRPGIEMVLTHLVYGFIRFGPEFDPPDGPQLPAVNEPTADFFRRAFEQSPRGMFVIDVATGELVAFNAGMVATFGFPLEEELRLRPEDMRNEDTPEDDFDLLADLFAGKIPYIERESARPHKDGRSIRYHLLGWPVRDDAGSITHLAHIITSLHDMGKAGARWAMGEQRIRYLARLSPDPILIVSEHGEVLYGSPSVQPVLGYDPDECVGRRVHDLIVGGDHPVVDRLLSGALAGARRTAKDEVRLLRKDGKCRWFEVIASNLGDVPEIAGIVLQARDIGDRKELESQLAVTARVDSLTNVLNRRGFLQRLDGILGELQTDERNPVLVYLDLDYFKVINDRYGHPTGDEVLVQTAAALQALVGERGFVGRMGGDEFVIALLAGSPCAVEVFTRELRDVLAQPLLIDGVPLGIGCSFGTSGETVAPVTSAELLRAADRALLLDKAARAGASSVAKADTTSFT